MHRTASSYYGYGTGTDRTFLCSQSHCPGRDSILVPSDLQARSLAPPLLGSPESKCSFHIFSFPTGVKGLKISKGTSRIRTQVVGMERPGLHWRLGFNVGIPGPVPVNRMNQNLRKQPGWTAKLSGMSWNKMEILIHPTNFYNRGNTTAYHFWVGPDIPGRY